MNKIINIRIVVIVSLFFLSCSASKTTLNGFQSNPPFKVLEATYTKGAFNGPGVNGFSIYIAIDNAKVKLDTVYFRNTSALMKRDKNRSKNTYVGKLVMQNTIKDIQLHSDSKKEFGNQLPDISQKIPFQLKSNQAVVSYLFNNKIHYFKILNCIETVEKQ